MFGQVENSDHGTPLLLSLARDSSACDSCINRLLPPQMLRGRDRLSAGSRSHFPNPPPVLMSCEKENRPSLPCFNCLSGGPNARAGWPPLRARRHGPQVFRLSLQSWLVRPFSCLQRVHGAFKLIWIISLTYLGNIARFLLARLYKVWCQFVGLEAYELLEVRIGKVPLCICIYYQTGGYGWWAVEDQWQSVSIWQRWSMDYFVRKSVPRMNEIFFLNCWKLYECIWFIFWALNILYLHRKYIFLVFSVICMHFLGCFPGGPWFLMDFSWNCTPRVLWLTWYSFECNNSGIIAIDWLVIIIDYFSISDLENVCLTSFSSCHPSLFEACTCAVLWSSQFCVKWWCISF